MGDEKGIVADRIRSDASAVAGLDDPEAYLFDANLEALVDSVNREGDLPESGLKETHSEFTHALANRLLTLKWVGDHPEILDEPITGPIFLTGLPRSGTTFFQQLFDRNHDLRLIRTWETISPCPPPAIDPESRQQRIATVRAHDDALRKKISEFDAIHLRDAEGAEECHHFLAQTFSAIGFHNYMNVPSYVEYLFSDLDLAAAYRAHKRQLQLLQWGGTRKRWALKYPNHLIAMEEILRVHPDATFVMTHRDPVQTLASLCRLTAAFRVPRMRRIDPGEVGAQMFDFIARHLDRLMRFATSEEGPARIVNVDYYDLVVSPADTLAKAYQGLGMEMPASLRHDVEQWRLANPKGKRGVAPYTLEEFGLIDDEVAERFSSYTRHFDIPREGEAERRHASPHP
ncbi:MAG: sulfotransferase [bacterium]|nr:sulfotransferase [bacterium]